MIFEIAYVSRGASVSEFSDFCEETCSATPALWPPISTKKRPDCILPSLPRAKSATLLALCFTKLNPVTIPTVHSVLMNRKRRFRKLYSTLFPMADHIVTVSDGVADNAAPSNLESPAKESLESTIRLISQKLN